MSKVKHMNLKPLPKLWEPLKKQFKILTSRFFGTREDTIETKAEYYMLLLNFSKFVDEKLMKIEQELIDNNIENEIIYLNDFKKKIYYNSDYDIIEIGEMDTKDFQEWVRKNSKK